MFSLHLHLVLLVSLLIIIKLVMGGSLSFEVLVVGCDLGGTYDHIKLLSHPTISVLKANRADMPCVCWEHCILLNQYKLCHSYFPVQQLLCVPCVPTPKNLDLAVFCPYNIPRVPATVSMRLRGGDSTVSDCTGYLGELDVHIQTYM